jgi:hypothetical protein
VDVDAPTADGLVSHATRVAAVDVAGAAATVGTVRRGGPGYEFDDQFVVEQFVAHQPFHTGDDTW